MSDMPSPEAFLAADEAFHALGMDIAEAAENENMAAFAKFFMQNHDRKAEKYGDTHGN